MIRLHLQLFGGRGAKSGFGNGGLPISFDSQKKSKKTIKTQNSLHMKVFRKMDDNQFSLLINQAKNTDIPKDLNSESLLQKIVYMAKLNDKPTILNSTEFDEYIKENKLILCFRGTRPNGDLSAEEIHDMTRYSDKFYVGNGIHGDGLYTTTCLNEAEGYGESIMTIAIKKDAKIITREEALELYKNEKRNNTLVGESLRNYKHQRRIGSTYKSSSIVALQKGYDIIKVVGGNKGDGTTEYTGDYYIILNRAAIIIKE